MFTGIIEEVGRVKEIRFHAQSVTLGITATQVLKQTKIGDSIAVNGVCLTVTSFITAGFVTDVMPETMRRTSFARLVSGSSVNLERAISAEGRLGGHIVSGHIDGVGKIAETWRDQIAVWFTIQADPQILKLLVEKGSVAVDGISLTVADVTKTCFMVSTIPHTVSHTTLGAKRAGDLVNLETDVIGKYVEKLLGPFITAKKTDTCQGDSLPKDVLPTGNISGEYLTKLGF